MFTKFILKINNIVKSNKHIFFILLALIVCMAIYSVNVSKGLEENIIRLHIVANSNSSEDQALKLAVRDAVIEYMQAKLSNSKSIDESKQIINMNISNIKELVDEKIKAHGKNYPVKVELGRFPFPTKSYGEFVLPAGNYQALRVSIGNAEGSNWWCVLFPPLCFVDVTHSTVPDSVKDELKEILTEEEYSIITSSENDDDIPVKVKFKIVEFFQNSRIKFSGLISKIFK